MKKTNVTGLFSLIGFVLISGAWASPFTASPDMTYSAVGEQSAEESQAISGKITSLGLERRSFTLMASSERTSDLGQLMEQGYTVKVMTFQIDEHTTVQGKLRVGANADVVYRVDNGTNIAISVRATP